MIPDLDAYLERIRWTGERRPILDTLASLLRAHRYAIPFENLDILLQHPIHLDLASLQHKLVDAHRGGYCFEHVTLFAAMLEALGFAPTRHTARVVLYVPRSASPRTHMFLTVPLAEGTFVVDPGFGGLAPLSPVPLIDQGEVPGTATHWMARDDAHWVLRTRTSNSILDCWASRLEADNLIDFEVGNHYTSTHPASPFVNRLTLRATTPDGFVSVMNCDVTRVQGGTSCSSRLADRVELRALLKTRFGFDLPEIESIRVPAIEEWR